MENGRLLRFLVPDISSRVVGTSALNTELIVDSWSENKWTKKENPVYCDFIHTECVDRTKIKLNFHKNYSPLDSIQSPNGRLVRTADVADDTFSFSLVVNFSAFQQWTNTRERK